MEKSGIYFSLAQEERYVSSSGHSHDGIEIYYLDEGVCNYFIDGEAYTVTEGYTVIVPAGVLHSTNYGSKKHSRYLLNIPESMIDREVLKEAVDKGCLFDTVADTEPRRIFDRIAAEYKAQDRLSAPLIACYATEIVAHIARNKSGISAQKDSSAVSYATKRIKDGYAGEITLTALAAELKITPEHLSRRFKEETGFGFNEYLTLVRVQHAEHMLKNEPGRSVAEIAFAVGFNDSNYFSKRFREMYGIPPRKARK